MGELEVKLGRVRAALMEEGLGAVRLRGLDWFSWATCGGSATVLLAAETGVAEVLVTRSGAWVLTDVIEAERLIEEELPRGLEVFAAPWQDPTRRERFVAEACSGARVASDRPLSGESSLPPSLMDARASLLPEEVSRYRALGREAAEAMTEVLEAARPEWTGYALAGAASELLWQRGIEPLLTLVGDEQRLPRFRHATAHGETLGARAMLVFCARRHGLFANLTRFVYFRPPSSEEQKKVEDVARIEAAALAATRPGATLGEVYDALVAAYGQAGHAGAEDLHHQGGTCGYLSRDVVARPRSGVKIQAGTAVAWNPSLPGAKIEDTILVGADGLEILTVDPRWPSTNVDGRPRPDLRVR